MPLFDTQGAIFLALRRVPDIPENVFVQLLLVVVKNHRKKVVADIESIDADDLAIHYKMVGSEGSE